ncbi:MAG TPA: hypothetical protein VFW63_12235 [Acidimicrobiales bacterium]|nr:hypothetical protein [Acidimicrobiales bacterium]
MAIAVAVVAVVAVLVVIGLVLRQGSVGRLSEEAGKPPGRDRIVERPAGPDAEPMHPDPSGRPPGDTQPPDEEIR